MNPPPVPQREPSKLITDALAGEMLSNASLYINVSQETIIVTEDKVRLCLHEHLSSVESRRAWIAPAGIFATIVIALVTSSFKDFMGLTASEWKVLFVVSGLLCLGWLVLALVRAAKASTVDAIVNQLRPDGAKPKQIDAVQLTSLEVLPVPESRVSSTPTTRVRIQLLCQSCKYPYMTADRISTCPSCGFVNRQ